MVNSWDFFDTLSGRATGREPWLLFDAVGGPEFRQLRQRAESESADKTLVGIYRRLAEITGWPAAKCDGLRAREWDLELAAAFPIVANVRQVSAGDAIVSDTYFTETEVRQLADRIGIPQTVRIVATYGGKHHGWVWEKLDCQTIVRHYGDNKHADAVVPRRHGVRGEHFDGAEWTKAEADLAKRGLAAAAGAMRAARLQDPHPSGSPESALWQAQAAGNIGFLWAAAAAVYAHAVSSGKRRVLFCSRDTILLSRVFAALYADVKSGVLWTSRQTYTRPSSAFVDYVRREVTDDALVVDLHGTGASLQAFRQSTGLTVPAVIVVGLAGGGRRGLMHVETLAEAPTGNDGTSIEVLNYDTGGRVIDCDGGPVREPVEYDAAAVQVAHDAVASALRVAVCRCPAPSRQDLAKLVRLACGAVPRHVRRQHVPFHPIREPA